MKKVVFLLLAVVAVLLAGCDKDDDPKFDYDMELLYGKWRITHVEQKDGSMFDVTTPIAERVFKPTYITFNKGGSYSGSGEFGNGSGTYTATGKTIITYVDGQEYLRYDVLSLTGENAEIKMYEKGDDASMKLRVAKQ
jgi:uncharacterized lipoprotein NlpE involved in copper resistance